MARRKPADFDSAEYHQTHTVSEGGLNAGGDRVLRAFNIWDLADAEILR